MASARPGKDVRGSARYSATLGRRRSASTTSTRESGDCARAPARFNVVTVLPSPGQGLVTPITWNPRSLRSRSTVCRSARYWSAAHESLATRLTSFSEIRARSAVTSQSAGRCDNPRPCGASISDSTSVSIRPCARIIDVRVPSAGRSVRFHAPGDDCPRRSTRHRRQRLPRRAPSAIAAGVCRPRCESAEP